MIRRLVAGTLGALFDLVLPRRCVLCDALLDPADGPVCPSCREGFEPLAKPVCDFCGQPVPATGRCKDCRENLPPLERIRSALAFGGPAAEAVLALKAGRRVELAPYLADCIANAAPAGPLLREHDRLVPVPLHRSRLARRGFNQSVLISRSLARGAGLRMDATSLVRHRATPSQSQMRGRRERTDNVRDAFGAIRTNAFAGQSVCLVDDVVTTGATLAACARALLAAGARRVSAVTVARAGLG